MVDEEPSQDPLIGATLGGLYRVERLLGVGGMGRVYQARHELLNKDFAIKVLPEARADKPAATERFLREARAASKVESDHIVKVFNVDRDHEHRLFIVMELLEGENLAERIARGPIALEDAIEIARQTGTALQAAHDAGIVHRDLKPENIFLVKRNGRDFVKVLDFGISKIKNPEHGDPKLTATDQIVGTPLYISPELARGIETVDHRTDIYALGVILYEMLTGSPPFTGKNHFQLLYQHGNEAPDPPSKRSERAQIPAPVEAAILRALEKEPSARFDTMDALVTALSERSAKPKRRRWGAIAGLAAAALGGLLLVLWLGPDAEPAPVPEVVSNGVEEAKGSAAPTVPIADAEAEGPDASAPGMTKPSGVPVETADPGPDAAPVTLTLRSSPPGAIVLVDGERRGKTPLRIEVRRGEAAKVRFSLRGYRTARRQVVAERDQTVRVRLQSKSPPGPSPIKTDF
jgi:serine/threonine-protein kinase